MSSGITINIEIAYKCGLSANDVHLYCQLFEYQSIPKCKHGMLFFDVAKFMKSFPWPLGCKSEIYESFDRLVEQEMIVKYTDAEGAWYARGVSSCGWNNDIDSDRDDYDKWLARHMESVDPSLKQKNRSRPTGQAWADLRLFVFERDMFTCTYCGDSGVPLECDHVLPFSRGGSEDASNLTTSCKPCNASKGDKTPEEWRVQR